MIDEKVMNRVKLVRREFGPENLLDRMIELQLPEMERHRLMAQYLPVYKELADSIRYHVFSLTK